jgi:hypothetical protein
MTTAHLSEMSAHDLLLGSPPPSKEDVLFRADPNDVRANASLHFPGAGFLYAKGYRTAARLLTKHVIETGTDKNILVFPILYLYRHHIELVLKHLTVIGAYLVDKELSKSETDQLSKHRLDLLWTNFRPILDAVCKEVGWKPPAKEDIEGVDSYIRQMTDVDLDGQGSRYVVSKKGEPSMPHLRNINIRVFADGVERLGDFLEGLDAGFAAMEDIKNEMHAEHR